MKKVGEARRRWLLLPVALTAGILWIGCGGGSDKPVEPGPVDTIPIAWVSSAVVYDTLGDKKEHSFIYFKAEWCGYCRRLDRETLANPEVARLIHESFNAVQIDGDADSQVVYFDTLVTCRELLQRYNVRGYPTLVFLNRRAEVIGFISGYRSPATLIEALEYIRALP